MANFIQLAREQPPGDNIKIVTSFGDSALVPKKTYHTLYAEMNKYLQMGERFYYTEYIKRNPSAALVIPLIVEKNPDFEDAYYMDECSEEIQEAALMYISKLGKREKEF